MNKLLNGLIAFSLLSTSVIAKEDTQLTCYSTVQNYSSSEQNIYESIDNGLLPNYLDYNLPVDIVYTSEKCLTSSVTTLSEGLPDIPGHAQEGDGRTVTQTRGNVRSTYTQRYEGGRWVTKKVVRDIIDIPVDPV